MFDSVQIVDTSEIEHITLCLLENRILTNSIKPELLPTWFQIYLPKIFKLIS